MNQTQRGIAGTFAIALIVAALFYVPWRIESNGKLAWAPFYRNPVMGQSIRITETIDSRFIRLKGRPVWGIYFLQLGAIGLVGVGAYRMARSKDDEDGKDGKDGKDRADSYS